jgi:hypothetical protein
MWLVLILACVRIGKATPSGVQAIPQSEAPAGECLACWRELTGRFTWTYSNRLCNRFFSASLFRIITDYWRCCALRSLPLPCGFYEVDGVPDEDENYKCNPKHWPRISPLSECCAAASLLAFEALARFPNGPLRLRSSFICVAGRSCKREFR